MKQQLLESVTFTNDRNSDIISIAVKSHSPEESHSHCKHLYSRVLQLKFELQSNHGDECQRVSRGAAWRHEKDRMLQRVASQDYMQEKGRFLDDESSSL